MRLEQMFQKLLKNKIFISKIKNFYKENKKEVLDIILFGSTVRGKEKPNDIDLLILFRNKEDLDVSYKLKKNLDILSLNINIIIKTYDSLFAENFIARESFLSEGYSLLKKRFVAELLGYSSFILFKYELTGFNQSQRMRFQYSLYGRNKSLGMLKELSLIKFSDSILLSPVENSERTKDYLNQWNIKFTDIPILLPSRLRT